MSRVSLVVITKNAEELLEKTLSSVTGLVDEIILVDDYSTDRTLEIASVFNAHIYLYHDNDLGKRKAFAIDKARGPWILLLDSDEQLTPALKEEIRHVIGSKPSYDGYVIPYQNHFLGHPVSHGGENYAMLRLFKKNRVIMKPSLVHEHAELAAGKTGMLQNKILHYSYRNLPQTFSKFTKYAIREACQKSASGERTSFKKIFMYPVHMFWARFITDKGYKDGFIRIPLDIGFAYMEFITYACLPFAKKRTHSLQQKISLSQSA